MHYIIKSLNAKKILEIAVKIYYLTSRRLLLYNRDMGVLTEKIRGLFKIFDAKINIIVALAMYGFCFAAEIVAYYVIFKWNVSLVGAAPRNYFAVVSIAVGYWVFILTPQILIGTSRRHKLKQKLKCTVGKYKEIAKEYNIDCPKYSEFIINYAAKSSSTPINTLMSWAYTTGFLFSFFALLRVAEIDDLVALPILAATALLWGILWSVSARILANRAASKVFWGNVNLQALTREDTEYMQIRYALRTKRFVNRLLVFAACQTILMLFMTLALLYAIDAQTLLILSACVVGVGLGFLLYFSIKKYRLTEEKDGFAYSFRD